MFLEQIYLTNWRDLGPKTLGKDFVVRNRKRFHTLDVNEFTWKMKRQKVIQFDNKIDGIDNVILSGADFIILERQKKDRSCLSRLPENQPLSDKWSSALKLKANLIRVPDNLELRNGQQF